MRIVFAGTPECAVASLDALVGAGHDVVGVITRPDAPFGRQRVLVESPVAVAASALNIPLLKTGRLDDEAAQWVCRLGAELGVIVAYGGLVREPLLSMLEHGWINLHFSQLPKWRGAAPVQRALMAGETRLGVSVFTLVEELDAGDVLAVESYDVVEGTTAGEVLKDLARVGTGVVLGAVEMIARGETHPNPQQGQPSYAFKLAQHEGRLDLSSSTAQVLAHWAGVTPEPGAFVMHDRQPVKLLHLRRSHLFAPGGEGATTGTVVLCDGRAILFLADGCIELLRVQPAAKASMEGAAWLRGRGGRVVLS